MLHRRLRVLLSISYYHMLFYGLMPTTLRIDNSRLTLAKVSAGYLIYSMCLTTVLLMDVPYMMYTGVFAGYMRNNIVLQWGVLVQLILRLLAVLCSYGLVWTQRQRLILLYTDFLSRWRSHWRILRRIAGEESLKRMQLDLAGQLYRKLCVNYAMFSCSVLMQYWLLTRSNLLPLLMRVTTLLMLSVGRVGFFTLLLLLSHQFRAVQLALQALRGRLRKSSSQQDLRRIAAIHFEWLLLARRAFSIYDLANASIFVNMFAANVSIFYHAVQFGNKSIKSDYWGMILGDGLITFNIWSSILVMNMVDDAVNSCNNASQLIRQFNDLKGLSPQTEMELEHFVSRLRNNRLAYRICACVVLDKPACLGYMASVLGKVIILMQFDLRRERSLVSENIITPKEGH